MSLDHDMRMKSHTVAKKRIRTDRAEWTDPDILAQSGGVIDDGCRVNGYGHWLSTFRSRGRQRCGSTIIAPNSASLVRTSSTVAKPLNFHNGPFALTFSI